MVYGKGSSQARGRSLPIGLDYSSACPGVTDEVGRLDQGNTGNGVTMKTLSKILGVVAWAVAAFWCPTAAEWRKCEVKRWPEGPGLAVRALERG